MAADVNTVSADDDPFKDLDFKEMSKAMSEDLTASDEQASFEAGVRRLRALKLAPSSKMCVKDIGPSTDRVRLRENGLLNEKHMSPSLQKIAKSNKIESPLLKLPGEIRTLIWGFATDDIRIMPRDKTAQNDTWAFQFPRVCRQVYAETSELAYAKARFTFMWMMDVSIWAKLRIPAYREAVTTVQCLGYSASVHEDGKSYPDSEPLRKYLPGLKTVLVSLTDRGRSRDTYWMTGNNIYDVTFSGLKDWTDERDTIEANIKNQEGNNIQVLFRSWARSGSWEYLE